MNSDTTLVPTLVAPGDSAKIVDGAGTTIRSVEGAVWITQSGDPRDIVLQPGDRFTLDRNGLALVVAFEKPAVVLIERRVNQRAKTQPPAPASHRVWAWPRAA